MAARKASGAQGCGWLLALGIGILALGKCGSSPTNPPAPEPTATAASLSTPAYVAARSLRCRTMPDAGASVAAILRHAEAVTIVKREGDWSQLSRPAGDCWVATAFLTDAAPATGSGSTGTALSSATGTRQGLAAVGAAAAGAGGAYVAHRVTAHGSYRHAVRSARGRSHARRARRSSSGYSYGGSCPCSGSHICIGPRGGRYCITSGGNKRYGV